jgi:hypothetical protein
MQKLKLFFIRKNSNKGQSFMEMTLVLGVLLLLVLGMIEFGNLLNQYINLVDGAREGARFGSNQDPYEDPVTRTVNYGVIQDTFYTKMDYIVDGDSNYLSAGSIAPIILDPAADEVMMYFLSIRGGGAYEPSPIWCKFSCGVHSQSEAIVNSDASFITSSLDINAPNTGVLFVEIFYSYHQLLHSPIFTIFVPDPKHVHAYAVMPLSAVEPTPTPCPSGGTC